MRCRSGPLTKEFSRDLDEQARFGHKTHPTAVGGSESLAIRNR